MAGRGCQIFGRVGMKPADLGEYSRITATVLRRIRIARCPREGVTSKGYCTHPSPEIVVWHPKLLIEFVTTWYVCFSPVF